MNRHSFRTKNTLELHSLVYITIMCFVLLAFFLILGNVGKIVRTTNLDGGNAAQEAMETILQKGPEGIAKTSGAGSSSDALPASFTGGNGGLRVALFGDAAQLNTLSSQMMIMEQSFDQLTSLSELKDQKLLVLAKDSLSADEIQIVSDYVKKGGNVWFTGVSEEFSKQEDAKRLLGITISGQEETWPGIRISGDLALGSVMEEPEYEVTALNLTLSDNIKVYASALPKEYKIMEVRDLPSLIWRYLPQRGNGYVYVMNGDFRDTEILYLMLPTILSEIEGNYVYGVINAYCVFVEGFPYAKNETRESWERLYSRDKMQIAQDLIAAQYLRYYTSYGSRITYFSKDYQEFLNPQDKSLGYYTDTIDNSMGLLALKDSAGLFLSSPEEKLEIADWETGFSFIDKGNFCLPINFDYRIGNEKEYAFNLIGSAMGTGFYGLTNDVDLLLDYDGTEDVWDDYCKNQEVVFGIGVEKCGWLDRLTAAQAMERLYSHLTANAEITYQDDGVEIKTDADQYWVILKGKTEGIKVSGGTAKKIGERCWLVEVKGGHAVISYK